MIDQIRQQLQVVAEARKLHKRLSEYRLALQIDWEERNKELLDSFAQALEEKGLAEAELRRVAEAHYEATGDKHPTPGVEIKIVKRLEYDEGEAWDWAIKHTMALSLDRKQFERMCKFQAPGFVTIREEPQAQIAQDLQKATAEVVNDGG